MDFPENSWEAVCVLGSEERWCWQIGCTTCGAGLWRSAVIEIGAGRHPGDRNWVTGVRGRPVRLDRVSALHSADRAMQVLTTASLERIGELCPFPSWLGYLGVVLRDTNGSNEFSKALTESWGGQIMELLPHGAPSRHFLKRLLHDVDRRRDDRDRGRRLHWQDLEQFEFDLAERFRRSMRYSY